MTGTPRRRSPTVVWSGTVLGDAVSLSGGTAAFGSRNVGTGKTVTLAGAVLSGGDAANYNLTDVATTTAAITKRDITGAFDSADKVYDATRAAAAIDPASQSGVSLASTSCPCPGV